MRDDEEGIYALLARATGFEWDAGNALKVLVRHHVEPGECEQIFFREPLAVDVDARHSGAERRRRALGQTLAGRRLYLVFTLRGTLIRVIAARGMNRKERHGYGQVQARSQDDPGL